jgi:hypothetical protein
MHLGFIALFQGNGQRLRLMKWVRDMHEMRNLHRNYRLLSDKAKEPAEISMIF